MAIRERLRKTFRKKGSSSSSGGSTPSTGSDPSHYTGRTDIEYYKPNEIPKSKYKGRVDPEHKEKLDSYSFADAFNTVRRKSSQALSGVMSPGGTKSQSRRPSYVSHVSHVSHVSKRRSLAGPHDPAEALSVPGTSAGPPAALIRENSDDDTDVFNTGLSRQGTAKATNTTQQSNLPQVRLERQATVPDQPFTVEELEQAMTRATIQANENGTMRNSIAIAAH